MPGSLETLRPSSLRISICLHCSLVSSPGWSSLHISSCYPQTVFTSCWVSSQKIQSSQRLGEGRIYYLQGVKRTAGIFCPKHCSQQSWGSFKLREHGIFVKGLGGGQTVHAWTQSVSGFHGSKFIQWIDVLGVREDQHHSLDSSWSGGWVSQGD